MRDDFYAANVRDGISKVLSEMIHGEMPLLLGVRYVLSKIEYLRKGEQEKDGFKGGLAYFRAVDSETDHLPLSEFERDRCSQDYLKKVDEQVADYLLSESKNIKDHCERMIAILG